MALRFSIARFARADDGAIMVIWALSLAVFFALAALAFDVGRLGATQSELQSFADNVALAAAGELDGKADAISRAQAAAANLISDSQTFGNGAQALAGVGDYTLTFYRALPASDLDPMNPADITTEPALAIYAEVVVQPRVVDMVFASVTAALLGSPDEVAPEVGATAVAGFTQYACDITALMFCAPPGFKPEDEVGTMIQLRSGGGETGQWGPGNFGFLRPSGGLAADPAGPCATLTGNQLERCLLAAQNPVSTCFAQRGVDMSPGQSVGSMAAAFNVRFDLYESTMLSLRNNPAYGPAPNVISGHVVTKNGGGENAMCHIADSTDTVRLPRDDCFPNCARGRIGDGEFSAGLADYVATNYGTAPAWLPSNPQTRYEVYLAEIAAAGGGNILTNRQETGLPVCSAYPSSDPERRVLIAAGIDCEANAINGAKTDVPVDNFVRLFLTEPADPDTFDIHVEVLGSAQGNGLGGVIHDVVQLYR